MIYIYALVNKVHNLCYKISAETVIVSAVNNILQHNKIETYAIAVIKTVVVNIVNNTMISRKLLSNLSLLKTVITTIILGTMKLQKGIKLPHICKMTMVMMNIRCDLISNLQLVNTNLNSYLIQLPNTFK